MKKVIIIMTLMALGSLFSSCLVSPYKVLAGEMKIELNGSNGFSIDKSKVETSVSVGKTKHIPLKMQNYTDEDIEINIEQRIPDFTTDGYVAFVNGMGYEITTTESEFNLPALDHHIYGINIEHLNSVSEIANMEVWISVSENSKNTNTIKRELILRILVDKS